MKARMPLVALAATVFAYSCSSGESGGNDDEDVADGSIDVATDVATFDSNPMDDVPTEDVQEEVVERAPFGDPCEADAECETALCLQLEGASEGFCSQFCFDESFCPTDGDYDCVFVVNSGGDALNVCVPQDLCIDDDNDGFGIGAGCDGPDCDEENDTVNIGADEICDGIDNDCDGNIDDAPVDTNQACETEFGGVCTSGRTQCNSGILSCVSFQSPQEEVCDGLDNDCDGTLDEDESGQPIAVTCYGGPDGTEGVGECAAGMRTCVEGRVSECEGQVLPFIELCDGLDNDCDGMADEGDPSGGVRCDTGLMGVCGIGLTVCTAEGNSCEAEITPTDEICDALDNDCDGMIDESSAGDGPLVRACYTGAPVTLDEGVCVAGTQTCFLGDFGACVDEVTPLIETCNGLDDDCNGTVDDGGPGSGLSCTTSEPGICAQGTTACSGGGVTCVANEVAQEEVCDGLDNDCDGSTDEGLTWASLSRVCTSGVGACQRSGIRVCDPDDPTGPPICSAAPGMPADEICDGTDNNCNGEVDEGWDMLGEVCSNGQGQCLRSGILVCNEADRMAPEVCNAVPADPGTEVCDGLDNDCDGTIDNGALWVDRGAACTVGTGDCTALGVFLCDSANPAGALICSGTPGMGGTETCDLADNDCDGVIDNGFIDMSGQYFTDGACGNCFTDCTEIFDRPNGFGACSLAGGSPACELRCESGFFNLNGLPDDGCEFELDGGTVYVSESDGSDAVGCGDGPTSAGGTPCATINRALAVAGSNGASRIEVAAGAYTETVTLVDGISLFGGYNPVNWERNPTVFQTAIFGSSGSGNRKTIIADGLGAAPTIVDGFVIYGENATGVSENSYAIWIRNSGRLLEIRDNVIVAGLGGPGADGMAGIAGDNGSSGGRGLDAYQPPGLLLCYDFCAGTGSELAGGNGGATTCGGVVTSGGSGGRSECPDFDEQSDNCSEAPIFPVVQTATVTATGSTGANGGGSGGGPGCDALVDEFIPDANCACFQPPAELACGLGGADGQDGLSGTAGSGGAACTDSVGAVVGGEWVGTGGTSGAEGTHGSGGGGGGSGGGVESFVYQGCDGAIDETGEPDNTSDIGGSGGGGGAGGCGGTAGQGGSAGGGSFGIFVVWGANPGPNVPVITDNEIRRGFGGRGGDGGNGATGGRGGNGGGGGDEGTVGSDWFCAGGGGRGGNGGEGGAGGGGGGGCGGAAYGIYSVLEGGGAISIGSSNSFPTTGSGGFGGAGGAAAPGGVGGADGNDGAYAAANF